MPGIATIQLFIHHCLITSQIFMHKFNFRYSIPYLDKPFKELLIYKVCIFTCIKNQMSVRKKIHLSLTVNASMTPVICSK